MALTEIGDDGTKFDVLKLSHSKEKDQSGRRESHEFTDYRVALQRRANSKRRPAACYG